MIRIGIVGCGRILAAHLRGYQLLREAGVDDFRVTALCARKEDDGWMYVRRGEGPPQRPAVSDVPGDPLAIGDQYLSDFQDDVDVKVYTDYREMIAEGPIDAVNDFTTHALHHQVAREAFANGKHLLTQKPLAVSMAAAREMCAAAEARDLVFGVFENFRNAPQTRHLHWLFESGQGALGRLQMILLGYVGVWWAPNRIVAETPWRHQLTEAGGIALDLGVHFLDQMRCVAGEPKCVMGQAAVLEPERITLAADGSVLERMTCDADDTFMANYEFESGVVANLFASWAGAPPLKVGRGTVYCGSRGSVTGDDMTFSDGTKAALSELFEREAGDELKQRYFPLGLSDGFALNHHDWLEAIRRKRPPETSGQEGMRDLAAAFAVLESHAAGRRVEIQEVLSGALREYQRPIDERFGLTS
ncbi:MAG: Gfo/Idh/MocA family oxidoreductase [Planctomycetales bacterium]